MKKTSILLLFSSLTWAVRAGNENTTDSTGMPGDNLDLYGVLQLFKSAASMEAFEKAVNDPDNQVNNLDLNEDGNVDYIRVVDHMDKDVHAIVLQVPVSAGESQDVATIEIEKTADNTAQLQVVGDEDIYGKEYYVEPEDASATKFMRVVVVNVWTWPCVRFIYGPKYVAWASPWRFGAYPAWWKPWKPVAWHVHHRRVVRYRVHCHRVYVHRVARAHRVYRRHRVVSATVHKRHAAHHGPAKRTGPQRRNAPKNKGPVKRGAPDRKGGGRK